MLAVAVQPLAAVDDRTEARTRFAVRGARQLTGHGGPRSIGALSRDGNYNIEFIKLIDGRRDPAVLQVVNAVGGSAGLDAVIRQAERLPRPEGATGFQIRENAGAPLYTLMF